jgi:hypothetical protein
MDKYCSDLVPLRPDGLQVEENRPVQRVHWLIERIAWIMFLLFVVAAALGLTGSGGSFSTRTVAVGRSVLELPAIARWQAAESLTVEFGTDVATHEVLLGGTFLDKFLIEHITPQPLAQSYGPGGLNLKLQAPQGRLQISVRPENPGTADLDIVIDDADATARVFVLP